MTAVLPQCVVHWSAHSEHVIRVELVSLPYPHVITFSNDSRVRIWSCHGELLASLRQGPLTQAQWGLTKTKAVNGAKKLRQMVLWQKLRTAVRRGRFREGDVGTNKWAYIMALMRDTAARMDQDDDEDAHNATSYLRRPTRAHRMVHSPKYLARSASPRNVIKEFQDKRDASNALYETMRSSPTNQTHQQQQQADDPPTPSQAQKPVQEMTVHERLKKLSTSLKTRDRREIVSRELLNEMREGDKVSTSTHLAPSATPQSGHTTAPPRTSLQRGSTVGTVFGSHTVGEGDDVFHVRIAPRRHTRQQEHHEKVPVGVLSGDVLWQNFSRECVAPQGEEGPQEESARTKRPKADIQRVMTARDWEACTTFLKPSLVSTSRQGARKRNKIAPMLQLRSPSDATGLTVSQKQPLPGLPGLRRRGRSPERSCR